MSLLDEQSTLIARWPDVMNVPDHGFRARVARGLFRNAVRRLPIRVILHQRSRPVQGWGNGGVDAPTMELLDPDAFFARLGSGGLIGFGESYLAGDWRARAPETDGPEASQDPLVRLLTMLCAELPRLVPPVLQRLRRIAVHYQPAAERNTPKGSRSNISRHYDLSNDLFATFLDPGLSYSAALFDQIDAEARTSPDAGSPPSFTTLRPAQTRKIERLLDAVGVREGTRLLEIGTGWGELALRAAERGARVYSVTLSEEQLVLARERVQAAGLADRVTIELCDYRAVQGEYDAVVSVEMIEAVGEQYWPVYFATLSRVLAPGGSVGLQAITMPHDRMLASRSTYTWMHKYVFPGGLIPSVRAVHETAARAGLRVVDDLSFGSGYARTLRLWRERFVAHSDDVRRLGFDPIFERMWTFYLAYSEAGFRSRYLDVHQFVLRPTVEAP
jgi:cyclopropane-fatty-acyl-phospholipid synthase